MFDLHTLPPVSVLEGLTGPDVRALSEIAVAHVVERGDCLLKRGQMSTHFYIIQHGRLVLTTVLRALDRDIETALETKDKGDAVGWSALLRPRDALYSVYCVWPGSVIAFQRDDLEKLMQADTGLGYRLMRNVADVIGERAAVLQELWREEVGQRLERVRYWLGKQVSFSSE